MTERIISISLAGLLLLSANFAGAVGQAVAIAIPAGDNAIVLAKSSDDDKGAFLGIVPEEVTSDIAADYGVAAGQGVLVESTVDGSPADEAGLRANDILLAIGGQKLTGPSELRVQLDKYKEGDEVSITYRRGGNERTASVKLAPRGHSWSWSWGGDDKGMSAAPTPPSSHKWEGKFGFSSDVAFAGIVTQELSDGLKSYFKVEGGALISEVVEKSPAEKGGLKAGDIIVKIGSDKVEDEGDVSRLIRDMDPEQTV
ncbi:MAG: PDZ domain-containing protein [bacterium]|nr:PDZ domain-containing protein [bacterium]